MSNESPPTPTARWPPTTNDRPLTMRFLDVGASREDRPDTSTRAASYVTRPRASWPRGPTNASASSVRSTATSAGSHGPRPTPSRARPCRRRTAVRRRRQSVPRRASAAASGRVLRRPTSRRRGRRPGGRRRRTRARTHGHAVPVGERRDQAHRRCPWAHSEGPVTDGLADRGRFPRLACAKGRSRRITSLPPRPKWSWSTR